MEFIMFCFTLFIDMLETFLTFPGLVESNCDASLKIWEALCVHAYVVWIKPWPGPNLNRVLIINQWVWMHASLQCFSNVGSSFTHYMFEQRDWVAFLLGRRCVIWWIWVAFCLRDGESREGATKGEGAFLHGCGRWRWTWTPKAPSCWNFKKLYEESLLHRRSQTLFLDQRALRLPDAVLKRSNSFWTGEEDHWVCVRDCEDQNVHFTSRVGTVWLED